MGDLTDVGVVTKTGPQFTLVLCSLLWSIVLSQGAQSSFAAFSFIKEPSGEIIAFKGRPFRIDCTVTSSLVGATTVEWFKDGESLDFTRLPRYSVARNGSLLISTITDRKSESDEGVYQCAVTIQRQTIISRKVQLLIAGIARNFRYNPRDTEVYMTNTAMLECGIDSVPSANITWYKDNSLVIDRTSKYRSYPEGVLEIYNVEFEDLGTYHCLAQGVDRSRRSSDAKLLQKKAVIDEGFQATPPNFTVRPRDTTAMEGSKVILFCGAYGLGSEMSQPIISWQKDGVLMDFSSKKDGRVTMTGGGNLQILSVKAAKGDNQETDDAMYMCRVENDVDSMDAEAKLTVITPPVFTRKPKNVSANENWDVTLECAAVGHPKPRIMWYKDGVAVRESDYFEFVDETDLRIMGLLLTDSGIYQCFAENEAGMIQHTAQLRVAQHHDAAQSLYPSTPSIFYHVHRSGVATDPSEVPSQPKALTAAIVSTRFVTLSWGTPERTGPSQIGPSEIVAYTIRWQELGSIRERVTNTTAQEVNVQHLKPNTEYEFRVTAYNQYGGSLLPATLRVMTQKEDDVPSEPQNVQALPQSPTQVHISWEAPSQPKGPILTYDLFYYPVKREDDGVKVELDGDVLTHRLLNLHPYTEYKVRMVAYNANGASMATEETIVRTLSDKPSDIPQNFTLETASSTSIVVRWQPPREEAQNGKITGYKIRYKKKGAKQGLTVTTAGDRDLYALTDLKKDTNYQVRISAQTVNGSGPPTPWKYAKTYEDLDESEVPDIPDRLVVRPTTNSLVVQWVPNRNSKIQVRGYYLGYGKGIPDVYRQLFDANTFFYTIENLQPTSEYVVSIRAFNNKGEGQPRYETVFTLKETSEEPVTPMLPPIGLKAIVLSAHTIVLTWTDNSLGKIQRITDNRYYTVKYNSVPARNRNKFVNSTDLNCHIDDLRPNTWYQFSVRVFKGRRKSTWSMTVSNKTQESAPGSMPRDLTPVPVENDSMSVTLNWQPPQKPNGQITGYLVFYTTDPMQDDLNWVVEGVLGEKLSMTITDLTKDTTYYFKVQARNSKGYGPMSSTVIYKTPKRKQGGIEGPIDKYPPVVSPPGGTVPEDKTNTEERRRDGESKSQGLSQNVMIIIIACVVGATFCIVVAVVSVILCRKRDNSLRNRRMANMYKNSPQKGKVPVGKSQGPTRGEGNPPDLWLGHDHQFELKNMGSVDRAESTISVASTRRNSHDSSSIHTNNPAELYQSGSEAEERLLPPPSYNQLSVQQQRNIIRPKPLKIPVDAQQLGREPHATVATYPNGHLMTRYNQPPNCPPSPGEDSGVIPMRPVYPRTQYQMQYAAQGPPRVNAGDISQGSLHGGFPMEYGCGFSTPSHHGSLTRRGRSPSRTPITGIASPVVKGAALPRMASTGSLGRPHNPLRSFSVPEPPLGHTGGGAPTTPKHIVKPQQTAVPYKKPTAPVSSGPIKPRSTMAPMVSPKSAPDVLKTSKDGEADIQKSLSTEELTAEMANLEGLMKDLNAITQQDFEC